ncbi:hypothetical protein [Micromonospora sp. NPDC048830]
MKPQLTAGATGIGTVQPVQNLRRGHYELAADVQPGLRVAAAFTELAGAI